MISGLWDSREDRRLTMFWTWIPAFAGMTLVLIVLISHYLVIPAKAGIYV